MPIRVASAPVSWGIMENREPPRGFTYARVLDEIAKAGFTGTELGPYGFLPINVKQLQGELESRGLQMCSAFVAFELGNKSTHATGLEQVERTAELIASLGAKVLVLSDEITPERAAVAGRRDEANRASWSDAEWRVADEAIADVIRACAEKNLRVAFHHHVGSHVETPEEIDRLFSLPSVPELGLCLDTGHCFYGGGEPFKVLRKYGARLRALHLKDIDAAVLKKVRAKRTGFHDAVTQGVFAALGQGSINFPELLKELEENGYDGWAVVEQDVLEGGTGADMALANATAARNYLKQLGVNGEA